ncbi:MAG: hypothetical protein MPJ06_04440 [Nitrosopumilus sp.]|nr:hypothetical protein [Nitrosopumilus sp.]MDA7943240.1 hypothetical protein [Nitrosopumilus sp.]MDA7998671.1 hypothetical protein [Nitrosopumilus sp.]
MAATIYDAIEMTLHACGGTITGKLAMQKLLYFQAQRIPGLGIRDYRALHYGPYSGGLAGALVDLSSFVLIYVDMASWSNNGFVYRLTEDGRECAEAAVSEHGVTYGVISEIVKECRSHCGLRSEPLYHAAMLHFAAARRGAAGRDCSPAEAARMAGGLGWDMTGSEAEDGMRLLRSLGLAGGSGTPRPDPAR